MTSVEPFDVGVVPATRLAFVGDLMEKNPGCAVGLFDRASNIHDPRLLFDVAGIEFDGHSPMSGGALVEFVAASDAWMVSDVADSANADGTAMRTVRLRNGNTADLHIVEIGDAQRQSVVIIVPNPGDIVAGSPPPTAIVASPRVGAILCDTFGIVREASESTTVMLGMGRDERLDGAVIINLLHVDDQEAAIANWVAAKEQRGVSLRWRCRVLRADGSSLWVEATLTNDVDEEGDVCVRADLYDISREVAATDALAAEKELLDLLTETLPVGVAKFETGGRVEHANGRLTELLHPLSPHVLLGHAARGELEPGALADAFAALERNGTACRFIVDHAAGDGTTRHLEWTLRPISNEAGDVTGGVVCVADVTEAVELRAALEVRATTDVLTGCLNRGGTIAALEHALANATADAGVGLLFIDLDDFKGVNDARGHAVGDAVLGVVASRLRGALRPGDVLGRLGGDEFVIIAPGLPSPQAALDLANRISGQLDGVTAIDAIAVCIAASIGVAWTSTHSASELLGQADAAMYAAKQSHSMHPVLSPASRAMA
jgi:diguanylate cyclase (GGDEF)-like protein/PAS domain S-box-containing protein